MVFSGGRWPGAAPVERLERAAWVAWAAWVARRSARCWAACWVGAVLKRLQQQGYGRQARSWIEPGVNQPLDESAVESIVGQDDIGQMAQRLGVPREQVAQAFAQIMPELVDQLTPDGELPAHADEVLDEGRATLEREIEDVQFREKA